MVIDKERKMKHLIVARSEMIAVAKEHKARGEEVRIHEAGRLETGRIIWVRKGRQVLVMR